VGSLDAERWFELHRDAAPIQNHGVVLSDGVVTLRPMRETDWDTVMLWNADPRVLHFTEEGDVQSRTLDEVQAVFRSVAPNALIFVVEADGVPCGDCWLQRMNLDRLLEAEPAGTDVRRIDLALAPTHWGRGLGTRVLRLLVDHAFGSELADAVYACDVHDFNLRSTRAFERVGFSERGRTPQSPGSKSSFVVDLRITRAKWLGGASS
jgi:RimJ/RimL family protein N-acetyltransferase